jgi:hypothetical protein
MEHQGQQQEMEHQGQQQEMEHQGQQQEMDSSNISGNNNDTRKQLGTE